MRPFARRGGPRWLGALAALLGSATLALAQIVPPPAPANEETDAPASGSSAPPIRLAPPIPIPPVSERYPAAPPGPRWTLFPRLLGPFRRHEEVSPIHDVQPPSPDEVARAQAGQISMVEAAAIKIRADEAGAPARRAAIRYLASVRCHYFPEAEGALVAALRSDRNESVRIEAAQALAGGCCCTQKTMDALLLAVSGSERDGNPGETSESVKAVANLALQNFAARGFTVPHPETLPPSTQNALSRGIQLTSAATPAEAPKVSIAPTAMPDLKALERMSTSCNCGSKVSALLAPAITNAGKPDEQVVLYLPPPTLPPPMAEPKLETTAADQILPASFTVNEERLSGTEKIKPVAHVEKSSAPVITEAERRFAETAGLNSPAPCRPSSTPAVSRPAPTAAAERLPTLRLAPIGVLPPQTPN